jgi:hypothetical protein
MTGFAPQLLPLFPVLAPVQVAPEVLQAQSQAIPLLLVLSFIGTLPLEHPYWTLSLHAALVTLFVLQDMEVVSLVQVHVVLVPVLTLFEAVAPATFEPAVGVQVPTELGAEPVSGPQPGEVSTPQGVLTELFWHCHEVERPLSVTVEPVPKVQGPG